MTSGISRRSRRPAVDETEVVEYLGSHPDFFAKHLDLLDALVVPHEVGPALSLVEAQVRRLRDKNHSLERHMDSMLKIARDNEGLRQRVHQLTLTLLSARGLEDALAGLEWGLNHYFQIDFVAVRIVEPRAESAIGNLHLAADDPGLALFSRVLEQGRTVCGESDPAQAAALFGELGTEVASMAEVPLQSAGLRGFIAIGSRDPDRFRPALGELFLTQLGEIVSARLAALLFGEP